MMIYFSESQIFERKKTNSAERIVNRRLTVLDIFEKLLKLFEIHNLKRDRRRPHPLEWLLYRRMSRFWRRLRLTLEMVKFEHSIFALPFALTGALLAWRDSGFQITGLSWRFVWIVAAMVSARSAAMAFNRILDSDIDSRNGRTAKRHLPAGLLSMRLAWGITIVSAGVFIWAARQLGPLCFYLSPVALATLFCYSFSKRFTLFSHLILGFCLGIAPAAAWVAMRGSIDPRIFWMT